MPADPPPPEDLVLRQLQGLRREFAAVLENQRRDRELILRLTSRMEEGLESLRRDLRDVRSDIVLLENGMLTRQNEILTVVRRLEESGLTRSDEADGIEP